MEKNYPSVGRKTFFISPPDVVKAQLVPGMIAGEFETYILEERDIVRTLFQQCRDVLVYVNLDDPDSWRESAMLELAGQDGPIAAIGGVATGERLDTFAQYADLFALGLVNLNAGIEQAAAQIAASLKEHHAIGQRKFLRFGGVGQAIAPFSAVVNRRRVMGVVHDISSVGLSCSFDADSEVGVGDIFSGLQIDIPGSLPAMAGRLTLKRDMPERAGQSSQDGVNRDAATTDIYVLMFDRRRKEMYAEAVHEFIYRSLQADLDRKIAELRRTAK
jgi:hypothetical protein